MKTRLLVRMTVLPIFVFLTSFSRPADAQTTYVVDPGGAGDFTAIQDCIDAAVDSDTCRVNEGTYVENIDFLGKDIVVESSSGPEVTVIDGNASGTVVTFENGETPDAVLRGFRIQNGLSTDSAGGILCSSSSPTVTDCIISGNAAMGHGAGIFCYDASPAITQCSVTQNVHGGIYCHASSPTIIGCMINGNSAPLFGGGILCNDASPVIINCTVVGNSAYDVPPGHIASGGGICLLSSSSTMITNSTFSGNDALYGQGIYCGDSSLTIANSILWADSDTWYLGMELSTDGSSTVTVNHCNVQGGQLAVKVGSGSTLNWGEGNISLNPGFRGEGDFHLTGFSRCIDTGDNAVPGLPPTDLDGNPRIVDGDNDSVAVVDMGAYEFQPAPSWSAASSIPTDADAVQAGQRSLKISFLLAMGLPLFALLLYIRQLAWMLGKSRQ